jgi:hypothetical protein
MAALLPHFRFFEINHWKIPRLKMKTSAVTGLADPRRSAPAPGSQPATNGKRSAHPAAFYLHRCIVCEDKIERTTANRKICKRSKCRNALKTGLGFGRYHTNSTKTYQSLKNPELMQEVPVPQRSASASGTVDQANRVYAERPWRRRPGS